jgi:predicted enzyme related to lactoylglutathione lyase
MINSFIHVNVYSDNPAVVVEFYNKKLGIPIQFEGFGDYEGACFGFIKDAPNICVWHKKRDLDKSNPVIILGSDGLDSVYQDLLSKGVAVNPPLMAEWGGRELTLKNPEGTIIMVLE